MFLKLLYLLYLLTYFSLNTIRYRQVPMPQMLKHCQMMQMMIMVWWIQLYARNGAARFDRF